MTRRFSWMPVKSRIGIDFRVPNGQVAAYESREQLRSSSVIFGFRSIIYPTLAEMIFFS